MTRRRPLPLLALCLTLAGCVEDHDACATCAADVLYESEVNDTAPQANWMGVLYPGDALSIRGHVTQLGPDLFDGFAFVTGAPLQIDVTLWADAAGVDLDLCVWDPVFGAYVTCFETSDSPEGGSFTVLEAGKEVHLVVRSFHGSSAYWLDVAGLATVYGAETPESLPADRDPDAWLEYAGRPELVDEAAAGRPAMLLDFGPDGELLDARPARVLPLNRS